MVHSAESARQATYLVEHYAPGCGAEELTARAARVRTAVSHLQREHRQLRLLGWTVVPHEESILCVFEARSERLVRGACARAGIGVDRISPVIAEDANQGRIVEG